MRQRYLIVKDKTDNCKLLTSTEWMTLENQNEYEVIAICDGLNNVKQYLKQYKL
jgi:hypothetical protein